MEYRETEICPTCRIHTRQYRVEYGIGRHKWYCQECGWKTDLIESNGNIVTPEQYNKETDVWR